MLIVVTRSDQAVFRKRLFQLEPIMAVPRDCLLVLFPVLRSAVGAFGGMIRNDGTVNEKANAV